MTIAGLIRISPGVGDCHRKKFSSAHPVGGWKVQEALLKNASEIFRHSDSLNDITVVQKTHTLSRATSIIFLSWSTFANIIEVTVLIAIFNTTNI